MKIKPGHKFGRWTTVKYVGKASNANRWKCRCDCGSVKIIIDTSFQYGRSKSCGCWSRELISKRNTTHGCSKGGQISSEYRAWMEMMKRCYSVNSQDYHLYGWRGIGVCKRWRTAVNFLKDIPPKPLGKFSLGRIRNNRNYSPSNVEWQTDREQSENRRTNRFVSIAGERLCLSQISRKYGVDYNLLRRRINRGWTPIKAATTKNQKVCAS